MNKRMCCAALMVISLSAAALAIDFMGPPTATLKQGQFKTDFTYHYSESDIEVSGFDLEFDDIETDRYYTTFTYGLDERLEVYGKLGGIGVESDGFDSSTDFTYGWGTRVTTNKSEEVDWGVGFLMSWLNADDDIAGVSADIDGYELQVAAGPTFKFRGWKLYGGIFYYMLDADFEVMGISGDLEEDSNVGAYIGTLMHLTKNIDAMVEVAAVSDGWGIGGNIAWKF